MDAVMTRVAPGWYADPLRAALLRWWDGAGWTRHTGADDAAPAPLASDGFEGLGLPAPDPAAVVDWGIPDVDTARRRAELWRDTAARIRALQRHAAIVHVVVDRMPPIVIDTRYGAFGWCHPLAGLPPAPREIRVEVQVSAPLAPAVFSLRHGALRDLLRRFEALAAATTA